MQAKQSSTASGMYSCSGSLTPSLPIHSASLIPVSLLALPGHRTDAQDEGLLHDARNLIGALGLYCDLLSMPGVLKPEHSHYAEELRLLGTRSGALIEHLIDHLTQSSLRHTGSGLCPGETAKAETVRGTWVGTRKPELRVAATAVKPVSLRRIVEHCSGLLSRVAGGRPIEVTYGDAAAMQVLVAEEAVERILVNLVRNSAAALSGLAWSSETGGKLSGRRAGDSESTVASDPNQNQGRAARNSKREPGNSVRETVADPTSDETPGAIRIGVGLLANRVGDPQPWPFRRVRMVVEDSGCGMAPEQLERLLCGSRAPSRGHHGIGFRVVRDLVATSSGDLRVMSAPGVGTRVQIEWEAAPMSSKEMEIRTAASRRSEDSKAGPVKVAPCQ